MCNSNNNNNKMPYNKAQKHTSDKSKTQMKKHRPTSTTPNIRRGQRAGRQVGKAGQGRAERQQKRHRQRERKKGGGRGGGGGGARPGSGHRKAVSCARTVARFRRGTCDPRALTPSLTQPRTVRRWGWGVDLFIYHY